MFRSAAGLAILACGMFACEPRRATEVPGPTPRIHTRVQLRCHQQSSFLQCEALASNDVASFADDRDVTDAVHWTSSDEHVVHVQRGRIRGDADGTATVTATLSEAPGAPSASVSVLADSTHGARQAFVVEGQVRLFPSSDGADGADVTLIDEHGVRRTVRTPSGRDSLGQFRFALVSAGRYTLRAVRQGYRANEHTIVVPDEGSQTLTLLPEPRAATP